MCLDGFRSRADRARHHAFAALDNERFDAARRR
jgi:hypothetical protein